MLDCTAKACQVPQLPLPVASGLGNLTPGTAAAGSVPSEAGLGVQVGFPRQEEGSWGRSVLMEPAPAGTGLGHGWLELQARGSFSQSCRGT